MTENNSLVPIETTLVEESANPEAFQNVTIVGENKTNLSVEAVRPGQQALISYILDCSYSCEGVKYIIRDALQICENAIRTSKGSIQVQVTRLGSSVEMQPFQYIDDVDFSYEANMGATRLYDAVLATVVNFHEQMQKMEAPYPVSGGIIGMSDGEDNRSDAASRQRALDAIRALMEEYDTPVYFILLGPASKFPRLMEFCEECGAQTIEIIDEHNIRRALNLLTQSLSSYSEEMESVLTAEEVQELIRDDVRNS